MAATKPPRELIKQIETIKDVLTSLNSLLDAGKIKAEYYGKDFLEPLSKIQTDTLELRNELTLFKNKLEEALTLQYYDQSSDRFASEIPVEKAKGVISGFLSRSYK